ncbi:odorant receptor 59a-like [Haematobia irritans]|uniref:odorant receptor 59a-like n=1 Tax=Haematobia irritans TaxID=7368 RepID=UPI003F50C02E
MLETGVENGHMYTLKTHLRYLTRVTFFGVGKCPAINELRYQYFQKVSLSENELIQVLNGLVINWKLRNFVSLKLLGNFCLRITQAMADIELDTKSLFKPHIDIWRLLGMMPPKRLRPIYWLYSLLVNGLATIGFPLHITLALFASSSLYEFIENAGVSLTCTVCAMKTFAIWWRFRDINEMFGIVKRQDERIRPGEEIDYMKNNVYPRIRSLIRLFYMICGCIFVFAECAFVFHGLRGSWLLMYRAYFPFDPYQSDRNYVIAHIYQTIALFYIVAQNVVNDTFAGSHLALLGGQVHILGMRVAKIGHDPKKTLEENNHDLVECIRDHLDLLEYRRKLEEVVSLYMFIQIVAASMNMCVVLIFIILFVKDPFTMGYFSSFFIGTIAEILPSCYYGTLLEEEFQQLAYALFSCNWPDQNLKFKKNLRIFAEQASRRIYVTAWLFPINNNAFLTACKNSYSIFALLRRSRGQHLNEIIFKK